MSDDNLFVNGARVRSLSTALRGTILGESKNSPDVFAVEWDDGELAKHEADDLELIDASLEQDYEAIQAALEASAAKLAEANALANKHNTTLYNLHYSDGVSFDDLFSELDSGGWSTSSMRC